MNIELAVDIKASLGEGPCWDENTNRLYWVDILEKKVHYYQPQTNETSTINVGQYVGACVPTKSGDLLLALENGFYILNLESEKLTIIEEPESHMYENRFNDGKCDPAGRFWAGTMHKDASKVTGSLYVMQTDRTVKKVLSDVGISNGLAWTADAKTMYFIDTHTREVAAFDYDVSSGEINNRIPVVTIPEEEGFPDGMTIDSEGMLWIAHFNGGKVTRWNPDTGELLTTIKLPVSKVTSCTFGGEHLNELYITTASVGLNEQEKRDQPLAGGVFRVKTEVKGTKTVLFG